MALPEDKLPIGKSKAKEDIIYLLENVAPEHKIPCVKSLIRKNERFDIARGLRDGDSYFISFLDNLSEDELKKLHTGIIRALNIQRPDSSSKTYAALSKVVHGGAAVTKPYRIDTDLNGALGAALDMVGNAMRSNIAKQIKLQYEEANRIDMYRPLEHTEIELCGKLYGNLLNKYLPLLEKYEEHAKFNAVIRKLLLEYQAENSKLSVFDLGLRLRYALTKLIYVLDNKGLVAQATELHNEVFRDKPLSRDGLRNVFMHQDKPNSNKMRPLLTNEIKKKTDDFMNKIKGSLTSLKSLLGINVDSVENTLMNSQKNKLVSQVANTMQKIDIYRDKKKDSALKLERRLLNRIEKVRYHVEKLQEDAIVTKDMNNIEEYLLELPGNRASLTSAFTMHCNKLSKRTDLDNKDDKSYIPGLGVQKARM